MIKLLLKVICIQSIKNINNLLVGNVLKKCIQVSSNPKYDWAKIRFLRIHHEHNHAADQNTIETAKSKVVIKHIDKVSGSTPSQIFNKVVNKIPKEVLMKMPTEESIKRTNWMQRSKNDPIEPTGIDDLILEGTN